MAKNEIVKLEGVVKTYFLDHIEVPALRGVDLAVAKGEFASIMGPSGSGKSTLMYLIGCLDRPTSGRVEIDGKDVSKLPDDSLAEIRREKIGFVFQQFNLIPRLTAGENVELPMWFAGLNKADRLKRATQLLERVGIADRADHRPSELSGGESQRVAIARALANDPEIILADEPTGNLDTKSGGEVITLLMELSERGKTVIMVTHDPVFGRRAGRTINIRDGVII
ncbi:MAG: ABC transporter ATP-binding protein [Candidatus Hydrothermarchaeaceae archaeon]